MRYAIGDSHAVFFGQSKLMECHWLGGINVVTMFQFTKQGLSLNSLKERIMKSEHYINVGGMEWQCIDGVYSVPNITNGDEVIFCFGFNDIQKNIYKYYENNVDVGIQSLIHEYIKLIKLYQELYRIKCIVYSIPPCPLPSPIEGKYSNGIFGDFKSCGSNEDRIRYTKYANMILNNQCLLNDLHFLNVYDIISDDEGYIRKEYTTDYVHLQWDNVELIEKIKVKLNELSTL